jgi:hypothetical protein
LSTEPGAESRTARIVAGEDVMGLPSSRGKESPSAMVNMRPLRVHSQHRPAVTPDKSGNATYRWQSRDPAYQEGSRQLSHRDISP